MGVCRQRRLVADRQRQLAADLRCAFYDLSLLRVSPANLGEPLCARTRLRCVVGRCDAFGRALVHALQNRSDPKQVVGQVKVPVTYLAAGSFGIAPPIFFFRWNTERSIVESCNATKRAGRNVPAHAVIRKVRQWMTERR